MDALYQWMDSTDGWKDEEKGAQNKRVLVILVAEGGGERDLNGWFSLSFLSFLGLKPFIHSFILRRKLWEEGDRDVMD